MAERDSMANALQQPVGFNAAAINPTVLYENDDRVFDRQEEIQWLERRYISKGSFATVYSVVHPTSGEKFVQKQIKKRSRVPMAEFRRWIENEIEIIRKVSSNHHMVKIFAQYWLEADGTHDLVLYPFANQGNLRDLLAAFSTSPDQTAILRRIFGCLASSLDFLHTREIFARHKDIKPENLLIHNGQLVVTGFFGIAQDEEPRNGKADVFSAGLIYLDILAAFLPPLKPIVDEMDTYSMPTQMAVLEKVQAILYMHVALENTGPISPIIFMVTAAMLCFHPIDRPPAAEVRQRVGLCQELFCDRCSFESQSALLIQRSPFDSEFLYVSSASLDRHLQHLQHLLAPTHSMPLFTHF
ncbi:hypothetical protein ASPZODRAFT_22987 [Penicilliopsis zonata CBS 506.65]|uniref:Protein kinase domain-containing protein n=1 Tax=Penicilliopsis zonata CBS 506.65 TaxID=1073090 RepID=A0A1L9ST94_9EURO|nr:hypothetical protein ASPZODRAFT_22987 [Penicilliopsis zonata CBS 506.65]OJJ50334.1 hypothetical protein ASPZODRAFT_22987 [Penicilliopsis zonata CBS 506.65]